MSIELVVSERDPPSVIMDIVNLPDPVYLGFTTRSHNYDDVGLYFRITGTGTGYTFSTVDLGLIASGGSLTRNLDNFCYRARPASETSEQIQLILRAYTDSGYTNLKWTYTKTLDVLFIKSDDGTWTTDILNNFDDGTVQTWSWVNESQPGQGTFGVSTDFVLSSPYSLRGYWYSVTGSEIYGYIQKSITTPNKPTVYAIVDIRVTPDSADIYNRGLRFQQDGTVLLALGLWTDAFADAYPRAKWIRVIIPLPGNTSITFRIRFYWRASTTYRNAKAWIDDFRVISK